MSINYSAVYGANPLTTNVDVISRYHSNRMQIKKIGNRQDSHGDAIHMGVELEVDGFPTVEAKVACALDIFRIANTSSVQRVKMEYDASLQNGFEIITQPIILRRHVKSVPWKEMMESVTRHGGGSHDGGRCGIHIHVEKISEEYQRNLWYLVNVIYRNELKTFSRRLSFNYCRFDSTSEYNFRDTGHSTALNTRTSTGITVEFRFIRGTTKPETFYESLRLIERLCWLAKDHTDVMNPGKPLPKFTSLLSQYGKEYYQEILRRRGI